MYAMKKARVSRVEVRLADIREVMVEGPSGLLAVAPSCICLVAVGRWRGTKVVRGTDKRPNRQHCQVEMIKGGQNGISACVSAMRDRARTAKCESIPEATALRNASSAAAASP